MQIADNQRNLLDGYLDHFRPLVRDRRTEETFRGAVQGILGAEALVCTRIAAFSPCASNGEPQRPAANPTDG